MGSTARSRLARYAVAVFAVLVALLARLALDPLVGNRIPFLFFAIAVVAVAWHGGFGPSFLTLLLGLFACTFFFLPPRYSLKESLADYSIQVTGFLFLGVSIGLFSEALQSARRRAEAHAREADRRRQELEVEVAQRKRLEQELQQHAAELAEADRRKDEFLAMLAHELRNPLAPIRNAVQVIQLLSPPEPRLRRCTELIERQVQHLCRLVDDLLDVSRITRGKVTLQKKTVDLGGLIAHAVEGCRPMIDARRHKFTVTLPAETVWLEADPTRLEQVLANLLANATRYTPEGGHVWLTAERTANDVVIRVRDDGIGIPAALLPKVFDVFTQGDRSLARSEGGLGIGLTLVKSLVEMHGGIVEARSEGPGKGSEFGIRFPAVVMAHHPTTNGAAPTANHSSSARRVLVVEDNADVAESLAMLLRVGGHEVCTAQDGPAALEAAAAYRPNVILLDIGLPRMDGYEVARRLREQGTLQGSLLIALTGYGQEEDRRRSHEAGFDAHLTKPADLAALENLLAGGSHATGNQPG
jgi:two-component system CheB/CheR fusion protein